MNIDFTSLIGRYIPQVYLQTEIFGNSTLRYLSALLLFIFLSIVFYIIVLTISSNLKRLARKTKTDLDDLALKAFSTLRPPFYIFIAFYLGLRTLNVNDLLLNIIEILLVFAIVVQALKIFQIVIDHLSENKLNEERNRGSKMAVQTVGKLVKIIVWLFALLFILSNFGVDITSLVAGLGIGGVAIALAVQNILGDLFSFFAINFDKPFVPGDFIVLGDKMGVVQKIGIKSTRIKALQGEELIISNKELSSAQIQNFKQMNDRRVIFSLGVEYGTPKDKLEKIPNLVKEIIESVKDTRFDRVHFESFGNSSLNFEVVYYVLSADYNVYMDIGQEINLKIVEVFGQEGIEFAFPTQTIHLAKN